MKTTTIILAATDVVLLDATLASEEGTPWRSYASFEIEGHNYAYSPKVIQALNTLQGREDIEFRWLTSLGSKIHAVQSALGLDGQWTVIEPGEYSGSAKLSKSNLDYWWKFDAFKQEIFTRPIRRLIWVDPRVEDHENAIDNWLDPYGVLEDDRLYLSTDENTGLDLVHLLKITQFLG